MDLGRQKSTELIEAARLAAEHSHSPYSHFPVGAVVASRNWDLVQGANVENASLGLTICAERSALVSAVSIGHRDLIALAVSCSRGSPERPWSLMPCGACRQVAYELLAADAVVLIDMAGPGGSTLAVPKEELLPRAFSLGQ